MGGLGGVGKCGNNRFFLRCSKLKNNKVISVFFWTPLRRAQTLHRHASDKFKIDILKCVIEPMTNVIFSMLNVLLMKFSL